MDNNHAKEIAKELRLIRKELQKMNKPTEVNIDGVADAIAGNVAKSERRNGVLAGDKVNIK
nr:hypothetical protein 6 [Bacilli bacterium]BDD44722.1 hypothetical protein 3 [bacterium]